MAGDEREKEQDVGQNGESPPASSAGDDDRDPLGGPKVSQGNARDAGAGAPSASADQQVGQPFPDADPPDDS